MRRSASLASLVLLGVAATRADEKPPVLRGKGETGAAKIVLLELYTSEG